MAETLPPFLTADDSRHGTLNGYTNLGCRCEACKAANRESHREYMTRVRNEGRLLGAHGSRSAYDSGCRCEACRSAHNERSKEYKRNRRSAAAR